MKDYDKVELRQKQGGRNGGSGLSVTLYRTIIRRFALVTESFPFLSCSGVLISHRDVRLATMFLRCFVEVNRLRCGERSA